MISERKYLMIGRIISERKYLMIGRIISERKYFFPYHKNILTVWIYSYIPRLIFSLLFNRSYIMTMEVSKV